MIADILSGTVEAAATGNNALAGAAAGAGSEAAAGFIINTLYKGKSTKYLSESEKQNVVFLSQLAGGLAAGLIGDSTQSAVVGANVRKRAVENNYLSKQDWADYKREIAACGDNQECIDRVKDKFSDINRANSETLKAACRLGGSSDSCLIHTKAAQDGLSYARENIPFDITSIWQANMMRSTKKDSEVQPSKALVGSEAIDMLERLASNTQYREKLANNQAEREKFKNLVDAATLDVRTEKGNAYEFGIRYQYPNISTVSGYNYFGRELGLEPVYPELYIFGGVRIKGAAKGINAITSTSTKVTVGVNRSVSAAAQYLIDGEIDLKQVLWDMAEARITKNFDYKKFAAWNAGAGFVEGYSEKGNIGDGLTSALSKWGISSFGYGAGKTVESGLNPYFNPYRRGFETMPAGLNGAVTRYKPENAIPTGVGNAIDNVLSKYIEYNIENIIIHNGEKK